MSFLKSISFFSGLLLSLNVDLGVFRMFALKFEVVYYVYIWFSFGCSF